MKRHAAIALGFVALGSISVAMAQANPSKPMAISQYAWPTESSPEPKDEEWASAQQLEPLRGESTQRVNSNISCTPRVVREWVQLTCETPAAKSIDTLYGVLWGMAGDFSKVKSQFKTANETGRYGKPPENERERLQRKMGAQSITTFQLKPGTAFVAQLDEMFWWDNYEGWHLGVREALQIDVSWAMGEKSPTMMVK